MVACQIVAAVGAEEIGRPDGAEAGAAVGKELVIALGAEVKVALDMGAAGGAAGDLGLAQEKVEHGADSGRHNEANEHPEARAHGAARRVFADVANHEEVERSDDAPGDVEVDAEAERLRRMMTLPGRDNPEIVFDENKRQAGGDDRPDRNEPLFFVETDGLLIGHGPLLPGKWFRDKFASLSMDGGGAQEVAAGGKPA